MAKKYNTVVKQYGRVSETPCFPGENSQKIFFFFFFFFFSVFPFFFFVKKKKEGLEGQGKDPVILKYHGHIIY